MLITPCFTGNEKVIGLTVREGISRRSVFVLEVLEAFETDVLFEAWFVVVIVTELADERGDSEPPRTLVTLNQ